MRLAHILANFLASYRTQQSIVDGHRTEDPDRNAIAGQPRGQATRQRRLGRRSRPVGQPMQGDRDPDGATCAGGVHRCEQAPEDDRIVEERYHQICERMISG